MRLVSLALLLAAALSGQARWTEKAANDWYAKQPWLVGANYIPATAINQLEIWQADTFDVETNKRELGWAADLGMNSVRVYLHDLLWQQDAPGFRKRIDQFLTIAARHHIRPLRFNNLRQRVRAPHAAVEDVVAHNAHLSGPVIPTSFVRNRLLRPDVES